MENELLSAVRRLRKELPLLFSGLQIDHTVALNAWKGIVDGNLLPRLSADFPLTAAICGGGSSGKSTLFNTLVGQRISPTGGMAGMNRRVLIAIHGDWLERTGLISGFGDAFGKIPGPLERVEDLLTPGPALFASSNHMPKDLMLLDTPDFDTGARGDYTNRDAAKLALTAADFLIYVFTNANYNNRDNTDFIAETLTGIGVRKCFLVYRAYPAYRSDEVLAHAMTVAHNIYGSDAAQNILGIYRADEDNEVAAGHIGMNLRPLGEGAPAFIDAVADIDRMAMRVELLASVFRDTVHQAGELLQAGRLFRDALALYLDALQTEQSHCAQDALKHLPLDRVMKRFAEIWMSTDPPFVKTMRKTGRMVDSPFRAAVRIAKWTKRQFFDAPAGPKKTVAENNVAADLSAAVTRLYAHSLGREITVSLSRNDPVAQRMKERWSRISTAKGASSFVPQTEFSVQNGQCTFSIDVPPVVKTAQDTLQNRDWETVLSVILAHQESLFSLSEKIESELASLVRHFRSKMGKRARLRQNFSALLNVLPATVAITYILSTGDPVGAAGIKVKLTGLFGFHDIYALVALPATTGLREADRKQLEQFVGPIVKAWLDSKFDQVQTLFEDHITGSMLMTLKETIGHADKRIGEITDDIGLLLTLLLQNREGTGGKTSRVKR